MDKSLPDPLAGREIIFEFRQSGNFMQVCAMDCATGIEVFVTTPTAAHQSDQRALAARKLARVLFGDAHHDEHADEASADQTGGKSQGPKRGFFA
jgi:hypothetical protein